MIASINSLDHIFIRNPAEDYYEHEREHVTDGKAEEYEALGSKVKIVSFNENIRQGSEERIVNGEVETDIKSKRSYNGFCEEHIPGPE